MCLPMIVGDKAEYSPGEYFILTATKLSNGKYAVCHGLLYTICQFREILHFYGVTSKIRNFSIWYYGNNFDFEGLIIFMIRKIKLAYFGMQVC